ncbi:protein STRICTOSIDINE SYNTHASE-LIKE 3-like [Lathyrus oleraceus]|uniref:protein STRICTOSIDINE SYNTHASE-LIKE 3-like n=1 Tax=Pisum sativum TaxID=3888 RepID=UPI0021CE4041|nr:protein STRICTOSIDINE SYNTHASE-LIKE 3-like [Pisum sativum]
MDILDVDMLDVIPLSAIPDDAPGSSSTTCPTQDFILPNPNRTDVRNPDNYYYTNDLVPKRVPVHIRENVAAGGDTDEDHIPEQTTPATDPHTTHTSFKNVAGIYRLKRLPLRKYWLKGEKAGTSEIFAVLSGTPDNVRVNKDGDFWVALPNRRSMYVYLTGLYPRIRKFILKLPIPTKFQFLFLIGGKQHGVIVKYSPKGKLLQILEDTEGKVVRVVSEVEEKDGQLWIGSPIMPFIAVYKL